MTFNKWHGAIVGAAIGLTVALSFKKTDSVSPHRENAPPAPASPKAGQLSRTEGIRPSADVPPLPNQSVGMENIAARAAGIMNNPTMLDTLSRMRRISVEKDFAELMDVLHLSSAERKEFIGMIERARTEESILGMKLLAGEGTLEEREQMSRRIEAAKADADKQVKGLFKGEASFGLYREYVDQKPERAQITALSGSLAAIGQPLSSDQSLALKAIVIEEKKNTKPKVESDAGRPAATADIFGQDAVMSRIENIQQYQSQIEARAASVLNPAQLAGLREQNARRVEKLRTASGQK